MSAVQELYKNYINGHWVDGGAGAIAVACAGDYALWGGSCAGRRRLQQ